MTDNTLFNILLIGQQHPEEILSEPVNIEIALNKFDLESMGHLDDEINATEDFFLIIIDIEYLKDKVSDVLAFFNSNRCFKHISTLFIGKHDKIEYIKQYKNLVLRYDFIEKPIDDVLLNNKIKFFLSIMTLNSEIHRLKAKIESVNNKLNAANRKLKHTVRYDIVTGLSNRLDFNDFLKIEIHKAKR